MLVGLMPTPAGILRSALLSFIAPPRGATESAMLDGWKGVIIILAGLALLGLLVFLKSDGAAVAAISAVTTLVAWLIRSPRDSANPPPGANIVPFAAVGLAAIAAVMTHACAAWTPADTKVAVDLGTQIACAIEHEELDDPALDALCAAKGIAAPDAGPPTLSPEAKRAVKASRAKVEKATATRALCRSTVGAFDGGAP